MTTPDDVIRGGERWCVVHGNCLDVLCTIETHSVQAVDPGDLAAE